jgi:hypothetical protein
MNKKYLVRLTDEERAVCEATVKNEKGKSEKLRRAVILLKADLMVRAGRTRRSEDQRGRGLSHSDRGECAARIRPGRL